MSEKVTELRQKVLDLRRLVFQSSNPGDSPDLSDLLKAEADLSAAEAGGSASEDRSATILSTAAKPTNQLSAQTTGLEAEVTLKMRQIPTSFVHLLDASKHPLVEVVTRNAKGDRTRRVRVTTFVEGYSAKAIDTVELPAFAPAFSFKQLPTFFPDILHSITEITRATVNVTVEDLDGSLELQNTKPVWMSPPTTAVLSTFDPSTGTTTPLYDYLAAFVTPNDPDLMAFLRTAAGLHPDRRLVGYQKTPVTSQVEAIYKGLKNLGTVYVNSVIAHGADQLSTIQRVRLPRETLKSQTANCIDATVLIASLLEAISINPAIVVVPGHAFVGWEAARNAGEFHFLETTMISSAEFTDAVNSATQLAEKVQASNPGGFKLCSLKQLRAAGIFPMA